MRATTLTAAALGAAMLAGCGGSDPPAPSAKEVQEYVEQAAKEHRAKRAEAPKTKTPFDAMMSGYEDMGKALARTGDVPLDAVHFSKLLPFVPEPKGWTGSMGQTATNRMANMEMTQVEHTYQPLAGTANTGSTVELLMADGPVAAGIRSLTVMMNMSWGETPEGYIRPVKVEGHWGGFTWHRKDKRGQLTLLIEDRLVVQITGTNVQETTLEREFLPLVDIDGLAEVVREHVASTTAAEESP